MAVQALSYLPTSVDATRFWEEVLKDGTQHNTELPLGFPAILNSPLAWKPQDLDEKKSEWFLQLGLKDVEAVDLALAEFEAHPGDLAEKLSQISPKTFVLPTGLAGRLRQVSDHCYHSQGFKVIRGLDPEKYSSAQNIIIYAGIASHVAPERGYVDVYYRSVISHVVNVAGNDAHSNFNAPPGFTNSALSFHTDNCEIMGLYCLKAAASGGATLLASSWNLYNELAAKRPDILKTLAEEWVFDTFKNHDIAPPRRRTPLNLADHDKISLRFNRYGMTGWLTDRDSNLPVPTTAQINAIDAVEFIASANCIRIQLEKGDILFVNDTAVMHSRESFDEEEHLERHLVKMVLRDPAQKWPVAESARADFTKLYGSQSSNGHRIESWDLDYRTGMEAEGLVNG